MGDARDGAPQFCRELSRRQAALVKEENDAEPDHVGESGQQPGAAELIFRHGWSSISGDKSSTGSLHYSRILEYQNISILEF